MSFQNTTRSLFPHSDPCVTHMGRVTHGSFKLWVICTVNIPTTKYNIKSKQSSI